MARFAALFFAVVAAATSATPQTSQNLVLIFDEIAVGRLEVDVENM
jgi:hypothetical protein